MVLLRFKRVFFSYSFLPKVRGQEFTSQRDRTITRKGTPFV